MEYDTRFQEIKLTASTTGGVTHVKFVFSSTCSTYDSTAMEKKELCKNKEDISDYREVQRTTAHRCAYVSDCKFASCCPFSVRSVGRWSNGRTASQSVDLSGDRRRDPTDDRSAKKKRREDARTFLAGCVTTTLRTAPLCIHRSRVASRILRTLRCCYDLQVVPEGDCTRRFGWSPYSYCVQKSFAGRSVH